MTSRRCTWCGLLVCVFSLLAAPATGAPFGISFSASGFQFNDPGSPGFDGPLSGAFTWAGSDLADPITALTSFDLTIYGRTFGLEDVGVVISGVGVVTIGGAPHGFDAVIADGVDTDFLLTVRQTTPSVVYFAYSLQGENSTLWVNPSRSGARFDFRPDPEPVPEPSLLALTSLGVLGVTALARRRRTRTRRSRLATDVRRE